MAMPGKGSGNKCPANDRDFPYVLFNNVPCRAVSKRSLEAWIAFRRQKSAKASAAKKPKTKYILTDEQLSRLNEIEDVLLPHLT